MVETLQFITSSFKNFICVLMLIGWIGFMTAVIIASWGRAREVVVRTKWGIITTELFPLLGALSDGFHKQQTQKEEQKP